MRTVYTVILILFITAHTQAQIQYLKYVSPNSSPANNTVTLIVRGIPGTFYSGPFSVSFSHGSYILGSASNPIIDDSTLAVPNINIPANALLGIYNLDISNGIGHLILDSAFTVTMSVGVENINADINSVQLYPNPNKGVFTLQLNASIDKEYTIYDLLGNIISQGTFNRNNPQIDVCQIANGVYTLILNEGQPRKFVVQH